MARTNWLHRYWYMLGRAGLTESFGRTVLAASHAVQRGAEAECSIPDAATWAACAESARARIVAACARETALRLAANPAIATVRAEFSCDPRGALVRIMVGGPCGYVAHNIPVPARGFTAAQIERLS